MEKTDKPIRVAQMMTYMNYGGVEMAVMNYYRHIDRTKIQFDFFALEGSTIPQREEIERLGGRVYVVPKYTNLCRYEKAIIEKFRENNYPIVHSHMNTLSVFSLRGAKKAGIPNRIAHNHSTIGKGETKKNIIKYALRPFAKKYPTRLCACSEFAGRWLYGSRAEFTVIKNAIEPQKYKYDENKRRALRAELHIEDKFVIGHIGRFCFQKNQEFLIDVFSEAVKKNPDSVLLFVGEGENEDLIRNKVKTFGLEDNVLFMGRRANACDFYQAMDCFVLPSRYEGFGIVAIEAQASGLPVVCSTCVPAEVKVTDSVSFLSLQDSPEKWAQEITEKKAVRKDMTAVLTEAGYDIETEAHVLLDYYLDLLKV